MAMQVPMMPFVVWLLMLAMTMVAVWVCRDDVRALAVSRPVSARFASALMLAVVGAVALGAAPLNTICDWNELVKMCGGWESCAWIAWYANACPWLE